ncbi:hypothetical protein BD560DRAFT_487289 [Blakeslea trispora]|nr:hypothetical protein BD560DRAFT_487289 [Blakeslea trispora]
MSCIIILGSAMRRLRVLLLLVMTILRQFFLLMQKRSSKEAGDVIKNSTLPVLVAEFFLFMSVLFRRDLKKRISISEANYNHTLLWPLIELTVDSLKNDDISFVCGEHVLLCSEEEYKADGVVMYHNLEILLLESSGKYLLKDTPRFAYDHVKAKFSSVMSLKIPFVHARGEQLYLWSLEICSEKLYAFQKIYESKVPVNWDDEEDILSLCVLVWLLERMLSNLINSIDRIKKEHQKAKTNNILGRKGEDEELLSFVNDDIKKPVRGANYGILLPEEEEKDVQYCAASNSCFASEQKI